MRQLLEVARTGATALLQYRLRSLVTVGCLVCVLAPYLAGLGLSHGVQWEAADAVRFGADLYVTGAQFGRPVPVPLAAVPKIRAIGGVTDVVPRIVGGLYLGQDNESAVLVGMPPEKLPAAFAGVDGRLCQPGKLHELVVGRELSRRLHLEVGTYVPPFYRSRQGERLAQVVGVFKSDVSLWEARLVLTTFDAATAIYDQPGLATDLLVYCRPGYEEQIRTAVLQFGPLSPKEAALVTPRVTTRAELEAMLPRGLLHREGVFDLYFVLAFAMSIPVVMVTSGLGLSERRREIGILKATGWQTDEVLLRGLVESCLLGLAAWSLAVILAYVWLRGFNGYGIASIFLAGASWMPAFRVPFRLMPVPALLAGLIAFAVILTGTLYSSWRAATAPPREAMR